MAVQPFSVQRRHTDRLICLLLLLRFIRLPSYIKIIKSRLDQRRLDANQLLFSWVRTTKLITSCKRYGKCTVLAVMLDCSGVIDMAFVLHSAGTVYPERWHYMTQFVINIVKQLDVGPDRTRVAVITWSNTAHVAFELNQFASRQDVVQVVSFAISSHYLISEIIFKISNS